MVVTWGATTVLGGVGGSNVPGLGVAGSNTGSTSVNNPTTAFSFSNNSTTTGGSGGGGLFGSSSTSFGGTTAPTSTFGGLGTGNNTSLFGNNNSNTPTTYGGLFGSSPATALGSSSMGFGGTAPGSGGGLFGPSSLFGQPQQQQQQFLQQQQQQQQQYQQQVLGRNVYEIVMENNARKEEYRIMQTMRTIYETYTGTKAANDADPTFRSAPFTTVLYNPATAQQRQLMALQQVPGVDDNNNNNNNNIPMLMNIAERPHQVSVRDWNEALVRTPDPNYVPIGITGADALQARVLWQQQKVDTTLQNSIDSMDRTRETIRTRTIDAVRRLELYQQNHLHQRMRLLKLLQKVEIIRCSNQPLQLGELDALEKLTVMKKHVENVRTFLASIQSRVTALHQEQYLHNNNSSINVLSDQEQSHEEDFEGVLSLSFTGTSGTTSTSSSAVPTEQQLHEIIKEHRILLTNYTNQMKHDSNDLNLVKERLIQTSTVAVPSTMKLR